MTASFEPFQEPPSDVARGPGQQDEWLVGDAQFVSLVVIWQECRDGSSNDSINLPEA